MWFFLIVPVVVIALEHVARLQEWMYRPSWTLTLCARLAEATWEFLGRLVAVTLRVFNLLETLHDLWIPCQRILLSPVFLIRGYMAAVENPWIHVGAAVCLAVLTGLLSALVGLWAFTLPALILLVLLYEYLEAAPPVVEAPPRVVRRRRVVADVN